MSERIREWSSMTGRDFAALDRERVVVLVTFSPLEVHGPHLPVITDNAEAEALAVRTAQLLCERRPDIAFIRMPPVFVAADVLPHPGSVMFRSSTVLRVAQDLGRSLAVQGFRHIWISSFHGGPRHFVPLEVACDRVNRRYDTRMISTFSLLIRVLTSGRTDLPGILGHLDGVSADDLVGDSHGGAVETSMMLHLMDAKVDRGFRRLPRRTVDIKRREHGKSIVDTSGRGAVGLARTLRGLIAKLKYYEDETYSGAPALASAELGERMIEVLAGHAADALEPVYLGKTPMADCHSPLWPARWIFMHERVGWALERAVRYSQRVF